MKNAANTIIALINYTATAIRVRFISNGATRFKLWAKCERNMKASLARM
jgi:hypothetical protein